MTNMFMSYFLETSCFLLRTLYQFCIAFFFDESSALLFLNVCRIYISIFVF